MFLQRVFVSQSNAGGWEVALAEGHRRLEHGGGKGEVLVEDARLLRSLLSGSGNHHRLLERNRRLGFLIYNLNRIDLRSALTKFLHALLQPVNFCLLSKDKPTSGYCLVQASSSSSWTGSLLKAFELVR